ncbi:MAG: hypothetical protein N2235_06630 [Fischerella sp.]|nr:hypothetical protein [Fischerella sp.]
MSENDPPNLISLKSLFTEGFFGSVVLGMDSTQVRLLLGEATAEYQYGSECLVWLYGDIEFSFRGQILSEISWQPNLVSYDPSLPSAGVIALDPWIICNGLTLLEAESELRCNSIEFRRVTVPPRLSFEGDSVVELITTSNARLIFRGYLNWFLEKFSLSKSIWNRYTFGSFS